MTTAGQARPGGRTARTREAVHAAVREPIGETASEHILIADVAARSGVSSRPSWTGSGPPRAN